jgi:tetratricopeptide (TPR) repeat protein
MSKVSEQSPVVDEASTWFDLGCTLQNAERAEEALSAFTQAQALDPDFPFLRRRIAWTHFMLQNYTTALGLYEALVCEAPGDGNAWGELSIAAHRCRQWDKALGAAERAFKFNPNDQAILNNYSIILEEFRRFKRARHLMDRAISLDPGNNTLRFKLGLAQLQEGDFKNGWKNYAARRSEILKTFPKLLNPLIPEWRGESLAQKNLLIWHESWEGHGDAILFVR